MKYRFTVWYQPEYFDKASNFLRNCDLDIGDVCLETSFMFTSGKKDLTIDEIKKNITVCFESDKCKVFKIEGGKVE